MAKAAKVRTPDDFGPLPSATLHVLVALTGGELHGYAIMQAVERVSDGAVRMGPGTLYGTLKRMLADGLVEETAERPDPALDDQRRRYYRLTALGERVCSAEIARLERLIRSVGSPEWARRRVPGLGSA
jgi:DNA-binding PadR family transcriptional regulator